MKKEYKIISIVGPGRSGSTFLGNVLGEVPGFFSTGELRFLWQRGVLEPRRCGCGSLVADCEVWSSVLETTGVVGSGALSPSEVVAWQRELARWPSRVRVLRRRVHESPGWHPLRAYTDVMRSVYRAVAERTEARVIVDSSKRAHDAAVAALLPDVSHYIVHLVRDPRAIAYSWTRRKLLSDRDDGFMGQRSPTKSAYRWMDNTLSAEILRRQVEPSRWLPLRYEDFVGQPAKTIKKILDFAEEGAPALPFASERTVTLGVNHNLSGNPNRFKVGELQVSADEAWKREMRPRDLATVTALTVPYLHRYGYPVRTRSGRGENTQ